MSTDNPPLNPPGGDFTFPSLVAAHSTASQSSPFGTASSAVSLQTVQQEVQLQRPVKADTFVPLTAQSTVTHASSRLPASQGQPLPPPQQQQQHANVITSQPTVPQPVPVAKVQAEGRRNKVPLEKGFSQVSWLKLTKSKADLTGGCGLRTDITLEEVQQHNTTGDAWTVLHGKVYNVTPYLQYHPGGPDVLMKAAGKDGTSLFNKFHPWVNAHALLEKCLLGALVKPGDGETPRTSNPKSKLAELFK